MIGRLIRWIFLEKSARTLLDEKKKEKRQNRVKDQQPSGQSQVKNAKDTPERNGGTRAQLREDALAAFRQRRSEFEKLDPDVQEKITAAAQRAFDGDGEGKKPK